MTRKLVSHWLKLISGRAMVLRLIIGHLYDLRANVLMVYGLNVLRQSYRSTSQEEGTWGQYGDRRSVPELDGVKGFTFPSFTLIPRVLI